MGLVVVTGASGFIGSEVCRLFRARGDQVLELSRSGTGEGSLRWSLGDALPDACRPARTIVHLACATLGGTRSTRAGSMDVDIAGTRRMVEQLRDWRRAGGEHRLVFVSSQSARPEAFNLYGRSKWAVEQLLDGNEEIVLRPGLVYSDPPASVFAMFDKLSRLPIIPALRNQANIQPVHVMEVANAIHRVSAMPHPPQLLMLGAITPLTFAEAVAASARRSQRRPPIMMPMPAFALRLVATAIDRLSSSTLTERLDGLLKLQPIVTSPSLTALGMDLAPF